MTKDLRTPEDIEDFENENEYAEEAESDADHSQEEAQGKGTAKKGFQSGLRKPMTREGFKKLATEHDELMTVERPKVVMGITIAAAEGDRSENAEYIYGKKRLRELDKRLRYLGGLLKDVQLVDPEKLRGDRVAFGSTVRLRDENGDEKEYTIVGEGEADYWISSVSWLAPVAKALLGKKVGDFVVVHRPAGDKEFEIIGLKFGPRSFDE